MLFANSIRSQIGTDRTQNWHDNPQQGRPMLAKKEFDQIIENTERAKKWVLLLFGLGLATFVSLAWPASLIARQGGNWVRVQDGPCVNPKVLGMVKPEFHRLLKQGAGMVDGKAFGLCWFLNGQTVFVLWEDGDGSEVPAGMFRKESEG